MILKNWVQHIIKGNTYQGLEIFELDNHIYYSFLRVTQKNGELFTLSGKVFENPDGLIKHINKKETLLVSINTSKVLRKQVEADAPDNSEQWVPHAFPNLDLNNFYYQVMDSTSLKMVALGKKEHIDQQLKTLEDHNIEPTSVSLGIANLENAIPYLKDSPVLGSNFELTKSDHGLQFKTSDSFREVSMEINGLSLTNAGLLPFSNILGHLGKVEAQSNLEVVNKQFENRFKNHRFFDLGLRWGLGVMLGVLLLNFLLFSYYRDKTQSMETASSLEQQNITLNTLKKKVSEKESRLTTLLQSSNSRSTFYLDRIAHEIPSSILLDEMEYLPLLKPVRDKKPIETKEQAITISGQTRNNDEFTQWTEKLEKQEWVQKVDIEAYEYDSKNRDNFSINVVLHEIGQ